MTKEQQNWQPVTLDAIEWLYASSAMGKIRSVKTWKDGSANIEFALSPSVERSVLFGTILLPPAEEWMWDVDGIPLDPLTLFEECDEVDESQITKRLPFGMQIAGMRYLFADYRGKELRVDPRKADRATHVLLQIPKGSDVRWEVIQMNRGLEKVRQYYADTWKERIETGREAFVKFLAERAGYRKEMIGLLACLPVNWSDGLWLDGKGDGQFLRLQKTMYTGVGSGGGGGTYCKEEFFRYNAKGKGELEAFLGREGC